MCSKRNEIIDTSSPESLRRDFYCWLQSTDGPQNQKPSDHKECWNNAINSKNIFNNNLSNCINLPHSDVKHEFSDFNDFCFTNFNEKDDICYNPNIKSEVNYCVTNALADNHNKPSSTNQLGRIYIPGTPVSIEYRKNAIQMYGNGIGIREISKRTGITHSCVSKIVKRYAKTGILYPKNAKEIRDENPLIGIIRKYYFEQKITRESQIRKQLIIDGHYNDNNLPSRNVIYYILRNKLNIKRNSRSVKESYPL